MKTAGGYIWSSSKYYLSGAKANGESNRTPNLVAQYNIEGEFIKEYKSIKQAASEANISATSIHHACNGTAGRKPQVDIWKYLTDEQTE